MIKQFRTVGTLTFILLVNLSAFSQKNIESAIDGIIPRLTTEEKIDLLCAKAPAITRFQMPQYDWWSEALHGVARAGKATVFPKPIALGSTWDVPLMEKIGIAISDEARAKYHQAIREKGYSGEYEGLTFFSPTLNIARDPRWGRTSECFSEDPLMTSQFGVAFIKGMQGSDPTYLKTVATAKHFVANNEEDRRLGGSSTVDDISLNEYFFPAFKAAVEEGHVTSVMSAYNALNGVPSSANKLLLTDILRNKWGFQGVVISDGSAIEKLYTHHHYVSSLEEGAALALKAGCDMSLRNEYRKGLQLAFQKKLISMKDIDQAVRRVLNLRLRLGIDKGLSGNPYTQIPLSVVESPAHRQLALEASEKSIIMLKNEDLLPLNIFKQHIKKIGLIGNAFKTVYYGDYSGTPEHNETLCDVLEKQVSGQVELKWIGERTKEELIPSDCLVRSADQAYDGILGFTGVYFNNTEVGQNPILDRQDLNINFVPQNDPSFKTAKNLSARWQTSLIPPETGKYVLFFSGAGRTKISINDSLGLNKNLSIGAKQNIEIFLKKGEKYALDIQVEGMDLQAQYKLTWSRPFNRAEDTPEKIAEQSDVVILFIRDDNSSEGRDRKTLNMRNEQIELIKKVVQSNPNTVLLLGGGTSLSLSDIVQLPKSILYTWINGQGESQAISNILLGKVNPSGKTPITFFANEGELPPMNDYNIKNGRSYEYFKGKVLFPFGFGLSYTSFEYGKPQLKDNRLKKNGTLEVSVTVTNKGNFDGDEIVQCYLSSPDWQKDGLKQKLAGFKRLTLKKGETKKVQFVLSEKDLLRWDTKADQWAVVSDSYDVSLVPNSGISHPVHFTYSKN